jgi:hypothetical protein
MEVEGTIVTYVLEYPGTNLIKIGQAKYYADRFAQLVTGSPIYPVPVCVFRGAKHEHELHAHSLICVITMSSSTTRPNSKHI